MAKNYLYKHVRAELGLPMGVETEEARDDGIIVRREIETAPPKPITYDRMKDLMKEHERMSERNEYTALNNRVNNFIARMWNEESGAFCFSKEQMQALCDIILDEAAKVVGKRHMEYVDTIGKETARIGDGKRELRAALLEAGFDIPEGKKLNEWAKYIREGVDAHERTE